MDIFDQVRDIVVDVLGADPDTVAPETRFKEDLKADSLDLVELLMAFEEKFQAKIPDQDVKKIVTVGDVAMYIQAKMAESAE